MIMYETGNLLDADTEALVNTVNTVGVMGKGIALQFKEKFPQNFAFYVDACKKAWSEPGKCWLPRKFRWKGKRLSSISRRRTNGIKNRSIILSKMV